MDLQKHKIVIILPEVTYNQYSSVQNYYDIQPVMHSMLIIPALTYTFAELRRNSDQLYIYEDLRWYRGLRKACKAIGIDFSEETVRDIDIVKTPQLLLDSPVMKPMAYCALGGTAYED